MTNSHSKDHFFNLDPYTAYIAADKLTNNTLKEIQKLLGKENFHIKRENYKKIEDWFETRFTLTHEAHNKSFKEIFGIDIRLLPTPITISLDNTRFSANHLFHQERYTLDIIKAFNKTLAHTNFQIPYDRRYHTSLYHFLDTVRLNHPHSVDNKDFALSLHPKINSLWDYFLMTLKTDLYEDQKQLHFNDNMKVLYNLEKAHKDNP